MRNRQVAIPAVALWVVATGVGVVQIIRHQDAISFGADATWEVGAVVGTHLALAAACGLGALVWRRLRGWVQVVVPLLVAVGLWLPTLGRAPLAPAPPPAGPDPGRDLVLITLDTFRADHLGALGGGDLTPNLDELASEGLLFTQAITTAPLTTPAHASLFTGQGVREHGVVGNAHRLDGETVVQAIHQAGYRTGAFLSAHVLDRHTGLDQGFTHYDDRWGAGQRLQWLPVVGLLGPRPLPAERRGDLTVDRALRWLRSDDRAAFMWVHLYDPHAPYLPPRSHWPDQAAMDRARALDRVSLDRGGSRDAFLDGLERGSAHQQALLYAAEVRWTDAQVGRLVAALTGDAAIVAVGDHGESLGEHDYWFNHGGRLWEPSLHVPLIVRASGVEPGVRDELVGIDQVARTLVALARGEAGGLLVPEARSSVPAYTPGQHAHQPLRSLGRQRPGPHQRQAGAIRLDRAKLVSHQGGPVVFHDLVQDPGEGEPVSVPPEHQALAEALAEELAATTPELGEVERRRLRALGYVE